MTKRSNFLASRVSFAALVATAALLFGPVVPANADPVPAITGTVTFDSVPANFTFLIVQLYNADGTVALTHQQDPVSGGYTIPTVAPGSYYLSVHASGTPGWGELFLGDVATMQQSTPITVSAGTTTTVGSISLHPSARIFGRTYIQNEGAEDADLELYILNSSTSTWSLFRSFRTHDDGYFEIENLPAATYKLRYESVFLDYAPMWWQGVYNDEKSATPVVLSAGDAANLSNTFAGGRGWGFQRLEGANRFETNVAISQELFPASDGPYSIPVLYIANGLNYPDALSAGPAASHLGGGLLLVTPTSIPSAILTEINRLDPQRIVVAGGLPSVSAAVLTQLSAIAPTTRIDGANRYETSRNLVADAFGCDAGVCTESVFIATGANFPDALSSGPAAASVDAPVLLVNGAGNSLDLETRQLISDLGASRAYILGNQVSVTGGVENSLESLSLDVTRFAGSNRYDTAALLNGAFFERSDYMFVASGAGFADALSGGPLAAALGAPLYLSPPNCGPIGLYNALIDLDVYRVYPLGSLLSLGDDFTGGTCGF